MGSAVQHSLETDTDVQNVIENMQMHIFDPKNQEFASQTRFPQPRIPKYYDGVFMLNDILKNNFYHNMFSCVLSFCLPTEQHARANAICSFRHGRMVQNS